jgi:hypothetical protein
MRLTKAAPSNQPVDLDQKLDVIALAPQKNVGATRVQYQGIAINLSLLAKSGATHSSYWLL